MAKAKKKAIKKVKKKSTKKKVAKRVGATGRPPISEHGVKAKINISIDPDIKVYLDKLDSRSSFVNDALRAAIVAQKAKKKATRGKKTGNKAKRKSSSRSAKAA